MSPKTEKGLAMESSGVLPSQLSGEAIEQLRVGINLLLQRWTALQMAIQNEWGGRDSRQKSDQLPLDLLSRLTQTKEPLYVEDLEDILDDFMISLNTEIGDGSIEEIAEKLMVMHEECLEGNFISIERLKEAGPATVTNMRQAVNNADDDSDTSSGNEDSVDMVVDDSDAPPNSREKDIVVDEPRPSETAEMDGWTVVSSKKNRGRRN